MCVIVAVRRFGLARSTFIVRGFEARIGTDRFGRITARDTIKSLLELEWRNAECRMRTESAERQLPAGVATELEIEEYQFEVTPIDPWAELLAFAGNDCARRRGRFALEVGFGPRRRRYPLPLSGKVVVGSDPTAAVLAESAAERAVEIVCEPGLILVCARGERAVVGGGGEDRLMLQAASEIRLEPTGTPLQLIVTGESSPSV